MADLPRPLEIRKTVMSELLGWSLRFVCLFAGIALISAESAWAQEQDGKVLVTACLISDVNSIQPGQKFRIGVLYRIEPGWHIYWKYPGDADIPTKMAWQLPEGFKVDDLQWPIPTGAERESIGSSSASRSWL